DYRFNVIEPPVYPMLAPSYDQLIVLDPAGPRAYNVMSANIDKLKMQLYRVNPRDYVKYQQEFVARFYSYYADDRAKAEVPGELFKEWVVDVEDKGRDVTVMTRIELKDALDGGLGHLVLVVEPDEKPVNDDYYRQAHSAWIQSTQMGLTAISDAYDVLGWVTDLNTGAPVANANITL